MSAAAGAICAETLRAFERDEEGARDRLFGELYTELSGMARRLLGQRQRTMLDTGALIHELYLKLKLPPTVQDSASFMALAAKAMRHVLIDHVRASAAVKRGGDHVQVTLTTREFGDAEPPDRIDLLALEQGLLALEQLDPRLSALVECRYFAGMEETEIACLRGVSTRTVQRDWRVARAFLQAHLSEATA